MKDKILSLLKRISETAKPVLQKCSQYGIHHLKLATASLAGLYWNLSPQNRHRVRLAAYAFAILSIGIVVGRVTNVNRAVITIKRPNNGIA